MQFHKFVLAILFALQIACACAQERQIPPTFHWIHLENTPLSKEEKNAIKSWQSIHPEWTFKLWTSSHSRIKNMIVCPIVSNIRDLETLKLEILQKEGGIWVHPDLIGCKTLDFLTYGQKSFISSDQKSIVGCAPNHFHEPKTILPADFILPDQVFMTKTSSAPLSGVCFWKFREIPSLTDTLRQILGHETKQKLHEHSLAKKLHQSKRIIWLIIFFTFLNGLIARLVFIRIKKSHFFIFCKYFIPSSAFLGVLFLSFKFLPKEDKQKDRFCHANAIENTHFLTSEYQHYFNLYQTLYENSLQLLAKPACKTEIPHVIHFIWGGENPFPEKSIQNIHSWMKYHPDWTFKFWTDSPSRLLPSIGMEKHLFDEIDMTQIGPYFSATKNWGEKSDLLRYQILYSEGGVYVDHDIECFRSFDALNEHFTLYAGVEPINPGPTTEGKVLITNCLIGAKPAHPVLHEAMKQASLRWDRIARMFPYEDKISSICRVLNRSFASFHIAVNRHLSADKTFILPATWLFPSHFPRSLINEIQSQGYLFADHKWDHAWFKNETPSHETKHHWTSEIHALSKTLKQLLQCSLFLFGLLSLNLAYLWRQKRKVKTIQPSMNLS